ncbi:MAG: RagB/SusD family nutrient uptake outer membrane protein [Bacteroidota bacterium]
MKNHKYICLIIFSIFLNISCKKLLEIEKPKGSLEQSVVFNSNDQATSAILGLYSNLYVSGFASGSNTSITCLAGASSDELIGYNLILPFFQNQLTPSLSNISSLYRSPYVTIYAANSILQGLAEAKGVTPSVKTQLEGEALFIRAFSYFYLANSFGAVPLQLTTDYRITQSSSNEAVEKIYTQIITDLKTCENKLVDSYPGIGRVRVNKSSVEALLARVYLYQNDWENAEKYSSLVIEKSDTYNLVALDAVFLANSREAIWQLMPRQNSNTNEGSMFIPSNTAIAPIVVSLSANFVLNTFEGNDKRRDSWVKSFTNTSGTYYYPFKYKVRSSTNVTEYSMVLRLAEQYLIRAEARVNQGKLDLGINDLNTVRQRPLITGAFANTIPALSLSLSKNAALLAIEKERRIELFSEWGHRWYDLKRIGKSDSVLGSLKSSWQATDKLYPIPSDELTRNTNIKQNEGY